MALRGVYYLTGSKNDPVYLLCFQPTVVPYSHLYDVDECSKFVADFIYYSPDRSASPLYCTVLHCTVLQGVQRRRDLAQQRDRAAGRQQPRDEHPPRVPAQVSSGE